MIDYYHYRPQTAATDETAATGPETPPRRRGRRLLIALFILGLLIAIMAAIGYWYLQSLPLTNNDGRTNLLILGVDDTASLSDTIMVVSIDQTADEPEVAIVGIPRDLYVDIPGFHSGKINSAFALGENNDYPGGGAALSQATLEASLGLPLHYYATIDFAGFVDIIDAVGGVTLDVKTDIDDPFYPGPDGGFEPFAITEGTRTLDGETALRYARSRQTTNDFDRAFRQQQVVLAVKDKLLSGDTLLGFDQIRALITIMQEAVATDLSNLELLKLGLLARRFEDGAVRQYVLDSSNLLSSIFNETGAALVPRVGDFSEVQAFLEDIFDQTGVAEFEQQQF